MKLKVIITLTVETSNVDKMMADITNSLMKLGCEIKEIIFRFEQGEEIPLRPRWFSYQIRKE